MSASNDCAQPAIDPETVLKWFQEAWPRAKRYPDLRVCHSVAVHVQVVRARLRHRGRPKPQPSPAAQKYGGLFQKHAPALRAQLEIKAATRTVVEMDANRLIIVDQEYYDHFKAVISAFEEAERNVKAALDALEGCRRFEIRDQDPARFIKEAAQEAWRSTGEKVPRSVNFDDPLCKFVRLALRHIGLARSAAAISAVLHGRNRLRLKGVHFPLQAISSFNNRPYAF
jgi:hypothetical protein